jgi:hypothetical protein
LPFATALPLEAAWLVLAKTDNPPRAPRTGTARADVRARARPFPQAAGPGNKRRKPRPLGGYGEIGLCDQIVSAALYEHRLSR